MRERLFVVVFALLLTCSALAQIPEAQHVFVVVEHGHSYTSVVNNPSMPYLNQLASQYGLATQYYANTHPAIGNYFTMTTGQVISNNDSFTGTLLQDNIVRHLLQAGKTWKSYAESLPSPAYTGGDKYPYLKRQNPFAYFSDVVNSSEKQNLVPLTQLVTDLRNGTVPNFSFIVPNAQNSMRDCPAGMSTCSDAQKLSNADKWLKTVTSAIMASDVFQKNGLLIVLFDESASTDTLNGGGHVAAVVAGPSVKHGYKSTTFYSHKNLFKTVLQALGVSTAPSAVSTSVAMKDMFTSPTTTTTASATTSGFAVTTMATSTATAGVTVTSPTAGSTVASPVHFVASANGGSYPITVMKIYVDYVAQYSINAASLNTYLSLSAGTHNITVQAWNSAGTVYKNSFTITVSSATSGSGMTTPATPYNTYVSTSGNDANDGSAARPYRTIQKAVSVAKAGTTVHVLNGNYSENVRVSVSGTASSRIIIKSENRWGAKIRGPLEGYKGIFTLLGNYIDVVGFEMYGNATKPYGSNVGVWIASSYNKVYGNLIHDLTSCQNTGCGNEAVGILVNFYKGQPGKYHDNTIYNNIIHHMYLDNHTIHSTSSTVIPAGSGVYICDGPNNVAFNNLAYSGGKQGFKLNHNAHSDKFINNTAADFHWDGFMMAVGGDSTVIVNDYSVFANNIAVDNKRAGINFWQASPSTIGTHNKLMNNLTYNNPTNVSYGNIGSASKPADAGGVHVDPKFVYKTYSGASGNFRLATGSPAIDKGVTTSAPSFDLDNNARPRLITIDIGAYEY